MEKPAEQAAFEDGPAGARADGGGAPEPAADDARAADERPRAATSVVLGTVGGVAVLVVAVLVAGMRLSEPTAAVEEVGHETEVPSSLAGGLPFGDVPPEIAAAVDEPVVGALVTSEPPEGIRAGCGHGMVDPETSTLRVVVTPDLADSVLTGPAGPGAFDDGGFGGPPPLPPGPMPVPDEIPDEAQDDSGGPDQVTAVETEAPVRDVPVARPMPEPMDGFGPDAIWFEQCTWVPTRGGWMENGGMSGMHDEMGGDMGTSMSCCDDGMATATASLRPPDGAAWALQDRGVYWLAYPTTDLASVPISWRFAQGPFGNGRGTTHVLWLDDDGAVVDERFVSS